MVKEEEMASEEVKDVLELKSVYDNYGHDDPEWRWCMRLLEEVGELVLALLGLHKHSPDLELRQIASIAMNWLEVREVKGDAEFPRSTG